MILKKNLKNGYLYEIDARNASFGVWNEQTNAFTIARTKFEDTYLFEEDLYEDGPPCGTATPLLEIEKVPDNILKNDYELLHYLKGKIK